ncbi:MAG: hypothetical protein A2558_02605 [Tenericutes bacterium RIFOXYD2_FULL_35_11]|nr:MAG: hypothetical protein A2558_02605 [Tenericutes bacterium RIFOXYD2_FULL_35_11]
MNKKTIYTIFCIGIFSIILGFVLSVIYGELLMLIMSVLTSLIAAFIFFVIQIYLPNKVLKEKYLGVYGKNIVSIAKKIYERKYFFEVIQKNKGIKISSSHIFYKKIMESGTYMYSYFSFQNDLELLKQHFEKLLNLCEEFYTKFGNKDDLDVFFGLKFDKFFLRFNTLYNINTPKEFFEIDISFGNYSEDCFSFFSKVKKLAKSFGSDLIDLSYELLTDEEKKAYVDNMKDPLIKEKVRLSKSYIYSNILSPNVKCKDGWYRVLDIEELLE